MLEETPRDVGAVECKTGIKGLPVFDDTPTLSELGITKKTSAGALKLAAMSDEQVQAVANREKIVSQVLREQLTVEKAGIGRNRSAFLQALTRLYAYCIER